METVREFTYLGDRESAGGECETSVTPRTRCEWAMSRECGELFHGNFPLKLTWLLTIAMQVQQFCIEAKHRDLKKTPLKFYERKKHLW